MTVSLRNADSETASGNQQRKRVARKTDTQKNQLAIINTSLKSFQMTEQAFIDDELNEPRNIDHEF
ncbi:MAG: hypothetical protein DU481_14705 [Nitrosomonas sp.]